MPDRIPTSINPEHAATRGFRTSGVLKLESMERLLDRLRPPFGEVKVEIEFGKDGRRMFLQGSIVGEAVLQCQRCLDDMAQKIDHQFRLGFIFSEAEIDGLLPDEEPLMLDGDSKTSELRLADVIEDELELLLPMVIKHSPELGEEICQASITGMQYAKESDIEQEAAILEESTSKKNPFDVLKDLKKH